MSSVRHKHLLCLSPQNDRLLAHVEVVLAELVLHDDRNARGQSLRPEHVELAGLPLSVTEMTCQYWSLQDSSLSLVEDAGDEKGQQQHAHNDEGGHHEGDDVLLRGQQIVDGVPGGVGRLLVLKLQAGLQAHHLKRKNRSEEYDAVKMVCNGMM